MVKQEELLKALELMSEKWPRQSTRLDKSSEFIYTAETAAECVRAAEENGADINYALHRWYNFVTSKRCEAVFVSLGAKKEKDEYHHSIDIYINGIPYDVKLTVYPRRLEEEGVFLNLEKRSDKNRLIKWLYKNQSQQSRKHLKSRIFIVCTADGEFEKQKLKCDFGKIEKQIKAYMDYIKNNKPNIVEITDENGKSAVYSDIIAIR